MSHGYWCNSRTIPLRCKYCGADVFYFSCDCGSRVFFDELGDPWPLHFCREYAKHITTEKPKTRKVFLLKREVSWVLIGPDEEYELQIEQEYSDAIRRNRVRIENAPNAIDRVEATKGAIVNPIGVVREVIGPINQFRKFGIPTESSIGVSLLGRLKEGEYFQVTIHATNLSKSSRSSYTFLTPRKVIEEENIHVGEMMIASLTGQEVMGQYYWYCTKAELVE